MNRRILLSTIFAAAAATMSALPAWNGVITRTLPDGSSVEILLHGDENFHYATLTDGTVVKEGADGFFYYAQVTDEGVVATQIRVGDSRASLKTVKSAAVADRIDKLRSQAVARRAVSRQAVPMSASDINDQHGLVILVDFPNMKMVQSKAEFSEMLNAEGYSKNRATGSALDYFKDTSYGKYSPVFDVYGPYTMPNNYRYYGKNNSSGDDSNVPEMIVEACRMASDDVDLTAYDYNNDGYIDNVYVFYAGQGEANGGEEDTIWPHRWVVYAENFDGDPDVGGVKVFDYACSNEIRESLKNSIGTNLEGIGTFVHEFGHVLGFSDHYSTNDNNTTLDPCYYDVMASASYLNYGRTPLAYSAYERMYMGWLKPTQLFPSFEGDEVTLGAIDQGEALLLTADGTVHNMDGVNPSPATYYLIENRACAGWDSYAGYYGQSGVKGDEGLLITKINYDPERWERNQVNYYPNSMGIELVCNSVQKPSRVNYYPMFPGSKVQTSVSFGSYAVSDITLDKSTGKVSFKLRDRYKPSGVETKESSLRVYASGHNILVEGTDDDVVVATPQGTVVYAGANRSVSVAPGFYLVTVAGETTKVAVR